MLRSIKGLKDILPQQTPQWRYMETLAHTLATQSGFSEIRIPIFESTELYARSIGGATDIVEKEMYTFPDRDGSSLTLRPEGTAGVVRAVLEHHLLESPSTENCITLALCSVMNDRKLVDTGNFTNSGLKRSGPKIPSWMSK